MITAGLDIGTRYAKAVILGDDGVLGTQINLVDDTVQKVSKKILKRALKKAGESKRRLSGMAITGYGRKGVKLTKQGFPGSLCIAKGIHYMNSNIRIVLDVGGLITQVVQIGEDGSVNDYLENEKCASGSGRFLELVAEALEVDIDRIGPLSLDSGQPLPLSSQCVVFAESEVINHVNAGEEPADILAGLHRSIAERVASLAKKLSFTPPVALVGGVAKNTGVVHFLEDTLESSLQPLTQDPQIVAALGAALLARNGN